ncbi:helix-turn-helix domain-containing protein [Novosphingobium terrae]|uniref:helix-turn-helix domain-containing protein n=1 Tax=Novosphingobium terrae TaxID=2726189 RepID=UPI00197EBB2A|nr:AraC family transcriptional regulator [Novosphingobium terrae]
MNAPASHAMPQGAAPFAALAAMLEDAAGAIDRDIAFARDRIAAVRDLLLGRPAKPVEMPTTGGLAPWQARKVIAHIDAHMEDTITNDELASLVRLSCGHFCRAFRNTFGVTPHAFVMQRRVDNASMMMIRSAEPLAAIAAACGFTDQAHLSRLFRRVKGFSPAIWRRQHMSASVMLAA